MLKTRIANETWLVHQPDHARVSGYLAAHWGNQDFSRPGYFAPSKSADVYREHVVHAIAEHDNGWWEWEASPEFDPKDGLPLNLPEVSRTSHDAGLQRWRLGIPRLADQSPYAALLISLHAYYLYAFAFDDLPDLNNVLRHPIFGLAGTVNRLVNAPDLTREFLHEQSEIQDAFIQRLRKDELWAAAVEPNHLWPHVRLLQLMDALSLSISFGGQRELTLNDIPRQSWDDRVTMKWTPANSTHAGDRRIICSPYPFDIDPLEVYLPVRFVPDQTRDESALVQLHATPLKTIQFKICS